VGLVPWPAIEARTAAIAGVEIIDLGSAAFDVPGIGVDLGDFDCAAKVHQDTASIAVGIEEKIVGRIIFTSWQKAVREGAQAGPGRVTLSYDQRYLRFGAGVIFCRGRNMLKIAIRVGVGGTMVING